MVLEPVKGLPGVRQVVPCASNCSEMLLVNMHQLLSSFGLGANRGRCGTARTGFAEQAHSGVANQAVDVRLDGAVRV
jgi:hypothetical protein